MKKLHISFIAIALFVLVFAYQTNAQITFQVGAGVGYSIPTGDYGGSSADFYNGTQYGVESGFNLHGKARVGLLFLNAFGEVGYTNFTGNGEAAPGQGSIDISHKLVSIKIGPEFPINIPLSPVTPYLQGFVSFNTISGNVEFQGVSNVPSGKYDIASASRVGLGVGLGAIVKLMGIKLDINIQYHAINIAGKEYKIENVTSHERLDNYTSLNDGKDPLYNANTVGHFIQNDRGIGALEFKLTAMFGM
jgi:hypothetical protein